MKAFDWMVHSLLAPPSRARIASQLEAERQRLNMALEKLG